MRHRPPDADGPRGSHWRRKAAGRRPARAGAARPPGGGEAILYGWHTVKAALQNPARRIRHLYATANAARRLGEDGVALAVEPEVVRPDVIARRLGPDAVHNGLLAEADPLSSPELDDLEPAGIVLVLDQITDPHNVGAILRTAAAFDVKAVVTTARHSPQATGVLAKSASGALEYVPIVTVQNQYNIDNRKWENALTYCEKEGIGFMPWSPIGGNRGLHDNALEAAAKDYHASMVQLALAWLLHHSRVTLPIPGTSSLAHLEENMAAAKLKLTPDDWKRIDALAT